MAHQAPLVINTVADLMQASRLLKELFEAHDVGIPVATNRIVPTVPHVVSAGSVNLVFQVTEQREGLHFCLDLELDPQSQRTQLSLIYPLPDWGGWYLKCKDSPRKAELLAELGKEFAPVCYGYQVEYGQHRDRVVELIGQKQLRKANSKFFLRLAERIVAYFAKARDAQKGAETAA